MLFDICRIGGINAACPIVRSATFEGMADEAGYPTERLGQTYERLADGGAGVIITGMMAVSSLEPWQRHQIRIDDDTYIQPLSRIVQRVHDHGGKIVAQIVVMGSAIMLPQGDGRTIVSPSGVTEKIGRLVQESSALTADQIAGLIEDVGRAASRAKQAGFDGVQFHGAHGYLASKFLSPYFNHRDDEYGGTLRNRARFLLECIAAIRRETGNAYPLWVKLNCADFMKEGGMTFDESRQVMEWIADAQASAIEVSGGNMSSLPRQGPLRAIRRTKEPMYFAKYAAKAAAQLKGRIDVGVVGGFRQIGEIEHCLNTTDIAFVSMSRPFLRQPNLPALWKGGSTEPATCISCSRCFGADNVDCIFHKRGEQ
ncbi:NADH:flavin oxidoreductase [uncultured Megasphaera sp.]|uniref:NADH:flavin oxidoreductase n=1 Tax=uncultured Megasphaera sp. TaxID=165188 RepID=UPI00265A94C7|nr:NADH:flavin oxidoreductase [uncultured Megasphaera sp.]